MDLRANIGQLKTPQDIERLTSIISLISDELDVLYTTTAPNGNISARIGRIAIYKNGSTYETWQNTDGSTTWQRIDANKDFQTGDWIISSVNTARTGWTNVSATYANKFMRISATPLSTGGADSVTLSANNLPEHNHPSGTLVNANNSGHTHRKYADADPGSSSFTEYDFSSITHVHQTNRSYTTPDVDLFIPNDGVHTHTISGSTGNNTTTATAVATVPAYITVCVFQKN
jgi:hypothetical protein